MLLKMFVPMYSVSRYSNAPAKIKLDGLVNNTAILKIVPIDGKIRSNYGDLVAHIYCGDTGDGYITAETMETLTRALR